MRDWLAGLSLDLRTSLRQIGKSPGFNDLNVLIDGQPETNVLGQLVSGNYYAGLGVSAVVGRTFLPADDRPCADPVAVISSRYWRRRFGGQASVVGKTVQVNRVPVTLVGVTPPGFEGAMQVGESVDISVPLAHHGRFQPDRAASRAEPWYWWIRVMGRLAPGASPAQARASLEPTFQDAARQGWRAGQSLDTASVSRQPQPPTLAADPGGQGENDARRRYRPSLRILMGLVSLALGASRVRIVEFQSGARQLGAGPRSRLSQGLMVSQVGVRGAARSHP